MGTLNDENKLQVDEEAQKIKSKKNLKLYNIINVNIRDEPTASETAFIQSPITSL